MDSFGQKSDTPLHYSREHARHLDDRLVELLRAHHIATADTSPLAQCMSSLRSWISGDEHQEWVLSDLRKDFQEGVGLTDFAANLMSVSESPSFAELVPHLRLLSTGGPSNAVDVATVNEATNKLFELLVGCWAIRAGATIVMEDPFHASPQPNPDIIANVDGERILLACKETFSRRTATHYERVEEGVAQIQRAGGTGFGAVVLHPRRLVPRSELFPMRGTVGSADDPPRYGSFATEAEPFQVVRSRVMGLIGTLGAMLENERTHSGFRHAIPTVGVLAFTHAVACCAGMRRVVLDGTDVHKYGPYPLSVRFTGLYGFRPLPASVWAFLERLRDVSIQSPADLFRAP